MATIALSDIHGRFDCLEKMVLELSGKLQGSDHTLVLLGDYIDRGPQSLEVLEAILNGLEYFTFANKLVVLKGNHEDMYLDALNNGRWQMLLNNGGVNTMKSLLGIPQDQPLGEITLQKKYHPNVQMAYKMFTGLSPFPYVQGKFLFVHAGIEPYADIEDQLTNPEDFESTFMWIRDKFLACDQDFGYHIVHGHTPWFFDDFYNQRPFRTNIDSGAPYKGDLTAAIVWDPEDRGSIETLTIHCDKSHGEP